MKNNIRITGGYLKGKNIPFDFKNSLRPTSSKLREVLFKDGLSWIKKSNLSNLDLILIDPPFNSDIETSVLDL